MQSTESSAEGSLEIELDPVPSSVGAARHAAGELAERVGANREAVELAVSEAVGNAVIHGFPHGTAGTVELTGHAQPRELVFVVSDDGVGMRPNPEGKGLGFGLPLIGQLAHELEITARRGGGTVLRMRFDLSAAA